jgi:hypothetical protein
MNKAVGLIFIAFLVLNCKVLEKQKHSNTICESLYKNLFESDVMIYKLLKDDNDIGQSIWLNRTNKRVKLRYFSFRNGKSVYEQFNDWKKDKKIILCAEGGYTTFNYGKPAGLTIENGVPINENVSEDMDALIVINEDGGVRVADLDQQPCCINLISMSKCVNPRNLNEMDIFLNWAKKENITCFQQHLLYYKNERKFIECSQDLAERRFLVIAKKGENIFIIIFNIPISVSLSFSSEIFNYINSKGMDLVSLINLHTGMGDVLEVFDERGNKIPEIKGSVPTKNASNLLVFWYE